MSKTLQNGLVVLFEGIDGVGKSTQLQLAYQQLQADDWSVEATRNLGGSPIGEALREVMLAPIERPPLTDLYMSVAIQEALVDSVITQRSAGNIVLIDRSPLSLAAYNIYGSGVDATTGWKYVDAGMHKLQPDLILYYYTDIATAVERARQHSGKADYYESKPLTYFEEVSAGYEAAAERYPMIAIDAGQSIEAINQQTMAAIKQLLT